jgi:hypothetical protein
VLSPSSTRAILAGAGAWFLHSGITEPNGGVARYYFSDRQQNARISTEITGYAVSALAYLHQITSEAEYREAAVHSARYLCRQAWSEDSHTFPFEPVAAGETAYAYFFDLGIIARGLLSVWRLTGDREFLERAQDAGLSMAYDFLAEEGMHPILTLPDKQPVDYDPQRWSRGPGCYQLKSALAWRDLAEATGQPALQQPFERMLEYSLATHEQFLPGVAPEERVMDRLHAYCYFLEALLFVADRPECRSALSFGIDRVAHFVRAIRPKFVRSDVYAQLLRVRLFADRLGFVGLDRAAASEEASAIPHFVAPNGGFWFGQQNGQFLPFINPVSTAFCLQALAMWDGDPHTQRAQLI